MKEYKYMQVYLSIRQKIEQNEYQKGDKLPSIRELTKQYQCNKDTILRALQQLRFENFIYPVEKSGYYVLKDMQVEEVNPRHQQPTMEEFPLEDFRRCLNESLMSSQDLIADDELIFYGNQSLLKVVQPLFEGYGVYTHLSQMVVTTGTQQALYILLQMIGEQGILLEQPTYSRMNQLVEQLMIPYQTIERTLSEEQIDLERLEQIFASGEIRYFYTISRFHNPLGVSYSDRVKKKIVELAQRYQIYIIEDDYMADYENGAATPLHYFDTDEKVIYIKSFSSIVFPAFKLGIVVLPKKLVERFSTVKQLLDYDSNLLLQKTMALYIENGMFHKYRQQKVDDYHAKEKRLKRQFAYHEKIIGHVHGTQVIMDQEYFERFAEELPDAVKIVALKDFYIQLREDQRLSLDFYQVTDEQMNEFAKAMKKEELDC